jgi:hypothetical protein
MSAWPGAAAPAPHLFGSDGELILLRVSVEPRLLEDLLETLARLNFPVNPELRHLPAQVTVEFPAYAGLIEEVRKLFRAYGFDPASLQVASLFSLAPA